MRITERGQVTIPKEIREKLGFAPNTEVEFVVRDGRVELVRSKRSRRKALEGLYGKKKFSKTTDELISLLRE